MRREQAFLDELGRKRHIDICLHDKVIEAADAIAEKCGTTRTELIELGLGCVFRGFIELVEEDLEANAK